jgi:hypothetical protein
MFGLGIMNNESIKNSRSEAAQLETPQGNLTIQSLAYAAQNG